MFVQNFIELTAAVHGVSRLRRKAKQTQTKKISDVAENNVIVATVVSKNHPMSMKSVKGQPPSLLQYTNIFFL